MRRAFRPCDKCKGNCWVVTWAGKQVLLCDHCHGVGEFRPFEKKEEKKDDGEVLIDGLFPDSFSVLGVLVLVALIVVGGMAALFWWCT